jgi:hypothetical protein
MTYMLNLPKLEPVDEPERTGDGVTALHDDFQTRCLSALLCG